MHSGAHIYLLMCAGFRQINNHLAQYPHISSF